MRLINKIALVVTFAFVLGIVDSISTDIMAQNATMTTKWTDRISDSPLFDGDTPSAADTVDVVYESDRTIVLKSDYIDVVWFAVDLLKADGFKIEDFVTFVEYNDIVTMVVMSKS
jgi:hypothetical protein